MLKELKVTDLKKTYGEKDLFDQISFLVHEKDRIGLIGTNGTGKTSLLNIIAGIDSSDGDRQTVFYPTDYRIGYLSQAAEFYLSALFGCLLRRSPWPASHQAAAEVGG